MNWRKGIAISLAVIGVVAAQEKKPEPQSTSKTTSTTSAPAKKVTKPAVAYIDLTASFTEQESAGGLFGGGNSDTLRSLATRLDKAANDKNIVAVLVKAGGAVGTGELYEMLESLNKFKKSGKKLYAWCESIDSFYGCALATVADEISMPPQGMIMITGMRMEINYYKGLFDLIGAKGDFLQKGDYKGAGEPYRLSEMSPQLREQLGAMLDDFFNQGINLIAKHRKLDPQKVKEYVDVGLFVPNEAKSAGLIDTVEYLHELRQRIAKKHNADDITLKANYGKKAIDTDFEGMSGFFKLMNMMTGADQKGKTTSKNKKIAVLYATGAIMTGSSGSSLMGGETMGSDTMVKEIRELAKDDNVLAIVLRVDSPGGSALASDLIWRELEHSKKPLVVSMGNVAGSGGYYIAMGADKIYAEPGTITGSIGVVSGKIAYGDALRRFGLNTSVIARGKNSGMFSADKPFTESERAAMMKFMDDCYGQFKAGVCEGRKMSPEKLETLAGGRVFSGNQAKANGLIDEVGTLNDALACARGLAKVDDKINVEYFPKPKPPFEALFGISDKEPTDVAMLRATIARLKLPTHLLDVIQMFEKEKVLCISPFLMTIK